MDKPYELDENGILTPEAIKEAKKLTSSQKFSLTSAIKPQTLKRRYEDKNLLKAQAEASARVLDEGKLRDILLEDYENFEDCEDRMGDVIHQILASAVNIKDVQREERNKLIKEIEDNAGEALFLLEDLPFWQSLKQPSEGEPKKQRNLKHGSVDEAIAQDYKPKNYI